MARYDYVLFDCDGTLLDTIADLTSAANHVCRLHGWPEYTREDIMSRVGDGQRVLAQRIVPKSASSDGRIADTVYEQFREYYLVHGNDETQPYEGVIDALVRLKEAGCALGVLTNKDQLSADMLVERHFGTLFDVVQGRRDGIPAKPHRAMTEMLMAGLGATPDRTVMVGDTAVDITCGKNVGIATCGVLWGFRTKAELEHTNADHLVEAPEQLVHWVLG